MFAYDAVLGILASLYPVVVRLFSFNHATDGRFTAARPSPPVPLVPWVPFPLPLATPALSRTVSPLLPFKIQLFFCTSFNVIF
jgi:hypothetical protein